jgi:hypothetical protein
MKHLEDRLRDAFSTAAETVRPESAAVMRETSRPARSRRLAPLAAAAAVAVVAIGASVITPLALTGGHGPPPSPPRPTAPSGTQPSHRGHGLAPRLGPAPVRTIPDTLGMRVNQALALLQTEGFDVRMEAVTAPGVPGTVVNETPPLGTRAPTGAVIILFVIAPRPSPTATPAH